MAKLGWNTLVLAFSVLSACGEEGAALATRDQHGDAGASGSADGGPGEPLPEALGEAVAGLLGPEGGTLRSSDGTLTLQVPAGALSGPHMVGVQELDVGLPQQAGKSFRLTPEGLTFAQPVVLTMRYADADLTGSTPELLRTVYRDAAGTWHMYKQVTLDKDAHTVSVETRHFSDWSLIMGAQILPLEAKVNVREELTLRVVSCLTPHEETDGEVAVEFGYDCAREPTLGALAVGWSVNGVVGGTEETGTLRESGDTLSARVVYRAPVRKPAQNPVAISVDIHDYITPLFGTQTLVSNIKVLDDSARWTGTISYEASGTHDLTIPSDFVGSENHHWSSKTQYTVTGVSDRDGSATEITLHQESAIDYEEDGARRKEVHEICQAGGPVILRHLFEYSIGSWSVGRVDAEIAGRIFVDRDTGEYSIGLDTADIVLDGQQVVVDKYTHFCTGAVSDSSGTKELHTVENSGDSFFEGTLDPDAPETLSGGYEKTLNDEYNSRVVVRWDLTRSDDP